MLRRHFVTNQQDSIIEDNYSIPEGYVDLGLSVMWAECNVGAKSPENPGLFYSRGNVIGHEVSVDGVVLDNCLFSLDEYKTSPAYKAATSTSHTASIHLGGLPRDLDAAFVDAQTYDDEYATICAPCIPNQTQWEELIENTQCSCETINGIQGLRFTASNGNSIFIPIEHTYSYAGNVYGGTNTANYGLVVASIVDDVILKYSIDSNGVVSFTFEKMGSFVISSSANVGRPIRAIRYAIPQHSKILHFGYTYKVTNSNQTFALTQILAGKNLQFKIRSKNIETLRMLFATYPYPTDIQVGSIMEMTVNETALQSYAYILYSFPIVTTPFTFEILDWEYPWDTLQETSGVASNHSNTSIYRIRYSDISAGITIKNNSSSTIVVYFGQYDDFGNFTGYTDTAYYSKSITRKAIKSISSEEVQSFTQHVDKYGFIYFRCSKSGSLTVTF